MTLEQQLLDLMEKHNLTAISVGLHKMDNGRTFPSAYAHANGLECGAGKTSAETIDLCLGQAIAEIEAQRMVAAADPVAPLAATTEDE